MTLFFCDCESTGLIGPIKSVQYAIDYGPVQILYLPTGWEQDSVKREELRKIRRILDDLQTVFVGFNVSFDLALLYRTFHALTHSYDSSERPVRPFGCQTLDLQVHAQLNSPLSPFAFNRNRTRSIARVRRVPKVAMDRVAEVVTKELQGVIPASFGLHLGVHRVDGNKDLVTLSWSVEGSLTLKGLAREYGLPTLKLEEVWPLPEKGSEALWNPYPDPAIHGVISAECDRIMAEPLAPFHTYAQLDVLFTRVLYDKLGQPKPDHHSACAAAIAFANYHGFELDRGVLDRSIAHYGQVVEGLEKKLAGIDLNSPKQRLAALQAVDPLVGSSSKKVLTLLADSDRPSAALAADLLNYNPSRQRLIQLQKVASCRTGRAHPNFRVLATPTARMAGSGGLNYQGIGPADLVDEFVDETKTDEEETEDENREVEVEIERDEERERPKTLVGLRAAIKAVCVGDFSSFEVGIGAARYGDKQLQADLDAGVDLHSMVASIADPHVREAGLTYEQIKAGYKAHDPVCTRYRKRAKATFFGLMYFASAQKVADLYGVELSEGQRVLDAIYSRYEGIGRYRAETEREFITADTNRWSRDSVGRMSDQREDMLGFVRRWTFEKQVADLLWRLGGTGIRTGLTGSIVRQREKGSQSIDGAVRSSLLGSAIAIQAAVCRQAGNFPVQATGANLCKMLMADCWRILRCPMISCHDELVFGSSQFHYGTLEKIVSGFETRYKPIVPSLKFSFAPARVWADK